MSDVPWFVDPRPKRCSIPFPGAEEEAERARRAGADEERVAAWLAERTLVLELRGLSAGDKAALDELKFTQQGDARLEFGSNQLALLELAIVSWNLDAPITRETVARLDYELTQAIIEQIPTGRDRMKMDESGGADGSGPSPPAAAPPVEARDAETVT
jgi:hypothetical protein